MGADSPELQDASFWCQTLGGLALYRAAGDQRPLMEAGKPIAALVYVALAPGARAKRDHLAELLWPGADLTEARHSLRQSLYRLRQATEGAPLVCLRGTDVELVPIVTLDCLEGERLALDGELSRAYELLRGGFLEGFGVAGCREFETWAEAQRVRFRAAWATAAHRLIERYLAAGQATHALEVAEELAAVHPFDDEAARFVMAALVGAGRHAAALAHYHAYQELLRREIDAEPDTELAGYARELEEYVKSRPDQSVEWLPLVGRVTQWAALETAWERARRGHGAMVLIEGGTGLGKSRLIEELDRRVEAADGIVLAAKCYDIERGVPYAAVADGLAPVVARPETAGVSPAWLAEAARLLPELRERFTSLPRVDDAGGSPAAKRRLHQAIARLLEAAAEDAPLLFAVDDVHWADGPSLEVLHFLSHRLRKAKVLLVAAYRPAELNPVARQFARSLCSAKLADLVVLDPLGADDVAHLLDALGRFDDATTSDTVARHLERHTGGNPLFLTQVLEALARTDVLRVRRGRWEIGSEADIAELPHTLGKLLADRVDALAPWMRACLETLAVAAAETPVEDLAQALQVSEPRVELGVAVLQEDRLVKRGTTGGFELMHDELRRLVYQGIPDDRRRLLHAAVGTALESRGEAKRPGGAARLAFHFDQAGMREPAHRYALVAAGEAEALAAPGERRAHLAVAEAHAPTALPPVAKVRVPGFRGFVRRHALVLAGAALVVLTSAAAASLFAPALWKALFDGSGPRVTYERTAIAVLPFQNLSPEGSHAYFASGLHDELLTQLAKVAALRPISRRSVMGYAARTKPLGQIAQELKVGSIIEVSVQVVGERLRVNVQLLDAASDRVLWADRYDGMLDDAFAIQSAMAQQIVDAVGATLSRTERTAIAEPPTANAEAYRLYLQAQDYDRRPGYERQDRESAQRLYEGALAEDPDFALAHAALARIHGQMSWFRYDVSPERLDRQREEAETALRLAPDLPEAHFAMGAVHYQGRRDWQAALAEYRIALRYLPNDAYLWAAIGYTHRRMGNLDEVYTAFATATQLDPRAADLFFDLGGNTFWKRRRYADAMAAYNRALTLAPDLQMAAVWKGLVYVQWTGELDTLRAALERVPADELRLRRVQLLLWERNPDSLLAFLGKAGVPFLEGMEPISLVAAWGHQMLGDHVAAHAAFDAARGLLDSVVGAEPDNPVIHALRGLALAGMGRRREALQEARWVQQSVAYREDLWARPDLAEQCAMILAQIGEVDAALDEIERILAGTGFVSVHTLRLDPRWDPLRSHARFRRLLEQYEHHAKGAV